MNIKQILDSAPKGATHVSDNGVYYFMDYPVAMNYWVRGQEWVESGGIHHLCRALADIKEIEQLKAELATANPEWISVEDGLPESRAEVLFYVNELGQIELGKYNGCANKWIVPNCVVYYANGFNWVTHWMPLPEPPKEQGE